MLVTEIPGIGWITVLFGVLPHRSHSLFVWMICKDLPASCLLEIFLRFYLRQLILCMFHTGIAACIMIGSLSLTIILSKTILSNGQKYFSSKFVNCLQMFSGGLQVRC